MSAFAKEQKFISTALRLPSLSPPLSGMNAFITLFRKAMGSMAAHYFAELKNSGR
ncbi:MULTISPECIES: hypothetical protein [Enterobacter]|uniref:hypothetical protein n=1 Tax=Enterobacter TaxID=547 RepID=UPI001D025EF2|nr:MULTISPECIES: hypothetical protein [Enterobacter]MCK7134565.1 hypothetical protein [Enterobacter bugandensis]MCK7314612.1 hypothetical protein [Enterobacter bugandensis]